jgi:hypothetical protein
MVHIIVIAPSDSKLEIFIQYLWYGCQMLKPLGELLSFGNNKMGNRRWVKSMVKYTKKLLKKYQGKKEAIFHTNTRK